MERNEEEALQRWFRACAELTAIKLRMGKCDVDRQLLVRKAEERIEKAAETYAEVVHASIQDADLLPDVASERGFAAP